MLGAAATTRYVNQDNEGLSRYLENITPEERAFWVEGSTQWAKAFAEGIANGDLNPDTFKQVAKTFRNNKLPGAVGGDRNAPNSATTGGKTCVYSCEVGGVTRYVGITDDVTRRGAEHMRSKGIRIEQIDGLDGLSRSDARAVEQALIHTYGLGKDGGTLINKINSISPTKNPTAYEQSLKRGFDLLDSVDYQWKF